MMLQLTAFTQSTKPDSANSSTSDKKLFNQVVSLYDNCQAQNAVLQQQVSDCSQYEETSGNAIIAADSVIAAQQRQIADADSIFRIQGEEMTNLNKINKDTKKVATRKTIGWTVGGFTFGVAATAITTLFLIKH